MLYHDGDLPKTIFIPPQKAVFLGTPRIPGSKYAAVRALIIAALADGDSIIKNIPQTDDTFALLQALQVLGVRCDTTGEILKVTGCAGKFPASEQSTPICIDVRNAGAVLRLLLGVTATLPDVTFTTNFSASLGKRPNKELLDALRQLGALIESGPDGALPIHVQGGNMHGGRAHISGARSSQFISALLLLAPLLLDPVDIILENGLVSANFVRLTLQMMQAAGVTAQYDDSLRWFHIAPGKYLPLQTEIRADFPTAVMWFAATAATSGSMRIEKLDRYSEDGLAALAALHSLGADVVFEEQSEGSLTAWLTPPYMLHGAALDGSLWIDSVPALAALAVFADGVTRFDAIGNLRLKESNRIDDLCSEFCKAGAHAEPGEDFLLIYGSGADIAGGCVVDAHNDHRLAMALAIIALRTQRGLTITGCDHAAKSYPNFWRELHQLGVSFSVID